MADGLSSADDYLAELAERADAQPRSTLIVTFSIEAHENEAKSQKAGRRIFEDVEIIEIRVPGERDVIRRVATAQDREQYARQYVAFRRSQTQETVSGFPLAKWAQMTKSEVEEARAMGVHTIEQLASISDMVLQRFGAGWVQKRQYARDWEKDNKNGSETVRLRNELQAMADKVKTLESMLARQTLELQRGATTSTESVSVSMVSPADEKIARLEAMVEKLAADKAAPVPVAAAPVNGAVPKRRGRPPKAKPTPPTEA